MLLIDDKIVSLDLLRDRFCCDLAQCKGICCVEGNAGAPLEAEEIDQLEQAYEDYKPYLKPEGIEAIERQGFMVVDSDGDYTTPLINDAECAYSFQENGITFCAIERAYKAGKTSFLKPISCHLYPIRLSVFSNGSVGLNYHRWDVCSAARVLGKEKGIPIYQAVREALIRRFGEEFYHQLEEADRLLQEEEK